MKTTFATLSIIIGFTLNLWSQDFNDLDKSPLDVAYYPAKSTFRFFEKTPEKTKSLEPIIKVYYSRPQKKGREIFGELVPFDKLWRTGANESTEITFYKNVKIGNTIIKPGSYALAVLPTANEWTLIINTVTDNWGVYVYDGKSNIAETKSTPYTSKEIIEAFSMMLYEKSTGVAHLKMGWDNTIVEFPIEILN